MKPYKLFYIISLITLSACESDLNLLPKDSLTSDVYFKTEKDFQLYANGLYQQLPDFGENSNDNMTDLYYAGGPNSVSNSTYIESQNDGTWNTCYSNIRNCLVLLEEEAKLEEGDLKNSVQVYKGEAHFFLAMNYYNLLRYFGGVPLIDHTLTLTDPDLYKPRASREDIVNFIIDNLDKAINAPVGTLTSSDQEGRITITAVRAFKARVALFEGTWRKFHELGGEQEMFDIAIEESSKVLEDPNYYLFDEREILGDMSYFYMFILESDEKSNPAGIKKESNHAYILTRKHNKLDSPTGYIAVTNGNLSPTLKLMDMFLDTKGLPITHPETNFKGHGFQIDPVTKEAINIEFQNRDPRMSCNLIEPFTQFWYHSPYHRNYDWTDEELVNTGAWNDGFWTSGTGYLLGKYIPEIEGAVGIDYPVIRLEEVMLIYAEALFERDGSISDEDLNKSINKLRDRVGMPHLTNNFCSQYGLDMRTEIRRERTIELMAEGFRYDDIRRWAVGETEMNQDMKGILWTNSPISTPGGFEVYNEKEDKIVKTDFSNRVYTVDENGFIILEPASSRKFSSKHYLRPLPLRQIALSNGTLEQNPGWVSQ
ncbi:RagB/SusD family nutrient uptake outer membrane protein [uncultured Bacteroides sp.]|uniref:RagB/SusD family nutrient uptake outer membrane protein n=1 Tax=uncultured Bacteroides sp. TaxID=162156 RepID=UPI00261CB112|nr:RagB/SusD family nutrient uptake outer membrane protein [uncultured Bacteroides sp.]